MPGGGKEEETKWTREASWTLGSRRLSRWLAVLLGGWTDDGVGGLNFSGRLKFLERVVGSVM